MELSDLEQEHLLAVANVRTKVLYTALKHALTPLEPSRFFREAGVPLRRGQLALAELLEERRLVDVYPVKKGWQRKIQCACGPTQRSKAIAESAIESDRRDASQRSKAIAESAIESDRRDASQRSKVIVDNAARSLGSRARDPDQVISRQNRPSVRGVQGGTDGRTNEEKFGVSLRELVGSIASERNWVTPPPGIAAAPLAVIAACLRSFAAEVSDHEGTERCDLRVTERELRRYLCAAWDSRAGVRPHQAFADVRPPEKYFGCVCKLGRFLHWREIESRVKKPAANFIAFYDHSCACGATFSVPSNAKRARCVRCGKELAVHASDDAAFAAALTASRSVPR